MDRKELLPHLFRTEYRKMVSVLCSLFGIEHIELAEDIVSDTFLAATESWSAKGVPENPAATSPIALDICAVTGGNPTATRVGNVTNVPEPTTELIVPAQKPARSTISTCHHSKPNISMGLLERV